MCNTLNFLSYPNSLKYSVNIHNGYLPSIKLVNSSPIEVMVPKNVILFEN